MKTHGLRALLVAGMAAMLLLAGAALAHASEASGRPGLSISFDLDNYFPTDRDEIAMTISVDLPPGCFDVEAGQPELEGNEVLVRIDAAEQRGVCAAVVGGFTLHRIVGPLPVGGYEIGAEVNVEYLCQGLLCESESVGLTTFIQVVSVGDANCDGSVNSIDATVVLQQSAGLIDTAPCPQGADANGDGVVQSIDAALILQYEAGLLGRLPPG